MKIILILQLMALAAECSVCAESEKCDAFEGGKNDDKFSFDDDNLCTKALSPGPRAVCAGHAYQRGKFTQADFVGTLQDIISGFPHDSKLYTVGYLSSTKPGLVIGTINDPHFDKSVHIPIDPRQLYARTEIMLSKTYKRPVLMYTHNQDMRDKATKITRYYMTPSGAGMRKNLFVDSTAISGLTADSKTDCTAFTSWTETEHLRTKQGLVLLADQGHFCPNLANVHFDVVLGEYQWDGDMYVPKWEISYGHYYGVVPRWAKDFF